MKKFFIITAILALIGVFAMTQVSKARNYGSPYNAQNQLEQAQGWNEEAETRTWTFSSADDPVFVASVDEDVTAFIFPSVRVRAKQGGDYKYFIVHKVELSGANTLVTLYGGTDYDLADAAITDVAFTIQRFPLGFPVDPEKWKIKAVISGSDQVVNPVYLSYYQLGSLSISIPVGVWQLSYFTYIEGERAVSNPVGIASGLSSSTSSFSENFLVNLTGINNTTGFSTNHSASYIVAVSSSTPYYFLVSATQLNVDRILVSVTRIEALSAYY